MPSDQVALPEQKRSATIFHTILYWIGVIMALVCFGLVLAGNTRMVWRLEHRVLPLSWVVAAFSILGFLAAEFCRSVSSIPIENEKLDQTEAGVDQTEARPAQAAVRLDQEVDWPAYVADVHARAK
jgi:hypothetical protein